MSNYILQIVGWTFVLIYSRSFAGTLFSLSLFFKIESYSGLISWNDKRSFGYFSLMKNVSTVKLQVMSAFPQHKMMVFKQRLVFCLGFIHLPSSTALVFILFNYSSLGRNSVLVSSMQDLCGIRLETLFTLFILSF